MISILHMSFSDANAQEQQTMTLGVSDNGHVDLHEGEPTISQVGESETDDDRSITESATDDDLDTDPNYRPSDNTESDGDSEASDEEPKETGNEPIANQGTIIVFLILMINFVIHLF